MPKPSSSGKSAEPTQRQLRVGEELRHALSTVLLRGETHELELEGVQVTVSEVRITPDLKHANAYVMPLGGQNAEALVKLLNEYAPTIRHHVTRRINLKYSPKFRFRLDQSFDEAQKIDSLLRSPRVMRDLAAGDQDDG